MSHLNRPLQCKRLQFTSHHWEMKKCRRHLNFISENRTERNLNVTKLAERLFDEMSLLHELVANQRCAKLTGQVLADMLDQMDDTPLGWCRGHSLVLLLTVNNRHQSLNGLRDKPQGEVRELMLKCLALTTLQR